MAKILNSYIPSKKLQAQAHRLLEEYPLKEVTERLRTLSRNMNREGEWLEGHTANVLNENSADASRTLAAAGDLINIRDMITDIAAGKPLERESIRDEGNAHLLLFESYHPRLPPRISKCLETTMDWCAEQMDDLDERTRELAKQAGEDSTHDIKKTSQLLRYLDETSGLLFRINQLAESAIKEVNAARKPDKATRGRVA